MWALEIQQIAKRNDECSTAGAIVNKCRSNVSKQDSDDIESLLLNEQPQGESSASDQMSEPHLNKTTTSIMNDRIHETRSVQNNNNSANE